MILNNLKIFKAMAMNLNSRGLNRDMIGFSLKREFGPSDFKEIKEYADATGDDFSKYDWDGAPAPPFFFSRKLYPMFKEIITHGDLKLDILRMVHGLQGLKLNGFISKDDSLSVEMSISDIVDTPAGEMLLILTKGFSNGKSIVEGETGFIVRRKKKVESAKQVEVNETIPGQDEAEEIKLIIKTFRGQQKKYAKVSRDTNPIHTSEFFARMAGLPGTILHGVCVIAMCANSLIDSLAGRNPLLMDSVSARFSFPVIPGDTLTLAGRKYAVSGGMNVDFDVFNSRGRTVVKKGSFHMNGQA